MILFLSTFLLLKKNVATGNLVVNPIIPTHPATGVGVNAPGEINNTTKQR